MKKHKIQTDYVSSIEEEALEVFNKEYFRCAEDTCHSLVKTTDSNVTVAELSMNTLNMERFVQDIGTVHESRLL